MTEIESAADRRHRLDCAQRNKGRVEFSGGPRIGLYGAIQRDAVLGWAGILPPDKVHRDSDLSRKPDLSLIAADFLRMAGSNVPETRAGKIEAGMKMANGVQRAYGVDDFPSWLGTTAQRSVTLGFDSAPETWQFLTQQKSVPNFKPFDAVSLPEFPSPAETVENGPVPFIKLGSDGKESSSLVSHTAVFGLSRQALTNNDLDGLTTVPEALGRAANRAVGDKFYAVLQANAAMSDGDALFSSAHGNLITANAAPPSVAAIDRARTAMTAQRGPSNSILNLRPAIILGPTVLESNMTFLRDAMSSSDDDSLTPGYIAGRVAVVTDARLDDADSLAWYILANPKLHSGIGVFFLEGDEKPLIEQTNAFVSDALHFKLMHDFAVLPTDFRSWVKNPGA